MDLQLISMRYRMVTLACLLPSLGQLCVKLKQWGAFVKGTNQYPVSFTEFAAMAAAGERNENTITACSVTGFTAVVGNTTAARTFLAVGV